MILADPLGSILAPYINTGAMIEAGSWAVEGIGEDFIPPNADLSLVQGAYSIDDRESFAAARELLKAEGIFGGSSSGTLLAAALKFCREQSAPKRVVSLVCDSGAKYLSKVFNDAFLAQEGWADRESVGTVRDVVINRFPEGEILSVQPNDTLRTAFARMRAADVSQLPVVESDRIVGLVDEHDILAALLTDSEGRTFARLAKDVMVTRLETMAANAPIPDLVPILQRDHVAIVMDGDRFLGLVTRMDLINYFRLMQR
jgi:cystathionine beta-synthase